jgi:hypothetical protein
MNDDDFRMVAMTAAQAAEIEGYIEVLMRANYTDRAAAMMSLALAYKFAPSTKPALPDNVVSLDTYSRKVPCA